MFPLEVLNGRYESLLREFRFEQKDEETKKEVLRWGRIITSTRRHKVNLIQFNYHIVAS